MPRLEVRELTVRFGGLVALDRVSLEVEEGRIVGLIGPNGAGKTTLLNAISRFCDPAGGHIRFGGTDLLGCRPHEIVGYGIARTFQGAEIFPSMSVEDNVLVGLHAQHRVNVWSAALRPPRGHGEEHWMRERATDVMEMLGLAALAAVPAGALNFMLRKRVDLARALVSHPRLLLLDEPAAGLTLEESGQLGQTLRRVRDRYECSLLLVEHDMALVMDVCEQIVVLDFGRVIASGPPEAVRSDPAVIEAYLGEVTRA